MKRFLLSILFCSFLAASAYSQDNANYGTDQNYFIIKINGGADSYKADPNQNNDGASDTYTGSLGTFSSSNTLVIKGGQMKIYKNNGAGYDVAGCRLKYRLYVSGNTPPSYSSTVLSWEANIGGGGGYTNQRWASTAGNTNLISSLLANSTYVLDVRWELDWTGPSSTSGTSVYDASATFMTDATLSVDMQRFTANSESKYNFLLWQTTSEKNNAQFNIQRSTNNQAWQTIGSVKATNNPSGAQYNFTDEAPLSNINYYRLQMVDNEGKVTYSKVVSVSGNDAKKSLAVYPNPVKAELNVVADGQATGVSIFDMTGKTVLQFNDNRTKVNVQDLPNGVYFMRLLDKNNLLGEPVRFVKQ